MHRLVLLLPLLLAACGGSAAPASPSVSPSNAALTVSETTIENAGLALVTPPVGFEERAGISGRGPSGELVLTGPFYGERALIAVCDGGSGEIAYALEGETAFTEILRCGGEYGGASRTATLATGYLVFLVRGDAAMRWHVAIAERLENASPRP